MSKTHRLKVVQPFFEMLLHGKNFEVRKNDRDYQVDDLLELGEFQQDQNLFTGRKVYAYIKSLIHLMDIPGLEHIDPLLETMWC